MRNILLIKTGAAGDIVRTTVLLNLPDIKITWVLKDQYKDILPGNHPQLFKIISLHDAEKILHNDVFDLTLSLEENMECAQLAGSIQSKKIIGVFSSGNQIVYSQEAAGWFDMSLLSSAGTGKADNLKFANIYPFQYWLFKMLDVSFYGEQYRIYRNEKIVRQKRLIGIEKRVGDQWPNKSWYGYDELSIKLKSKGFAIKILGLRENIRDYFDDIAECGFIISGDTLAMHVALAYHIPCVAIFNCTSPAEIYDYGILKKVTSPLLRDVFYKTTFNYEAITAIGIDEVESAFETLVLSQPIS
ncbi:MAG TPA: hypothetical protein VMT76_18510 [Puia sp.]|nr:hypothetical protein [Puia sp.]